MLGIEHITQAPSTQSPRVAIGSSVLAHLSAALLALWISTLPRSFGPSEPVRSSPQYDLMWLASPGPGGGGGGGGNKTPAPGAAREKGTDRLTAPIKPAQDNSADPRKDPPPTPSITIPAAPLAAAAESLPGIIEPVPSAVTTQGPGVGGGAGTGAGTGAGAGDGSGLGQGTGGGTGGGAFRPGSGVTGPQLVREVKPDYTGVAMRARIQGVVVLECVVAPDGSVGDIRIIKSLDKEFGLDEQAIKAARQWRFSPGRRLGEAVPVIIQMELSFTLR